MPVRIRNGNKRGIWRYEINDVNVKLDNGLTYSAAELNAYRHLSLAAEAAAETTTAWEIHPMTKKRALVI